MYDTDIAAAKITSCVHAALTLMDNDPMVNNPAVDKVWTENQGIVFSIVYDALIRHEKLVCKRLRKTQRLLAGEP